MVESEAEVAVRDKGKTIGVSFSVQDRKVAVLAIDGMTCNSCVLSIETNIGSLNGVESIRVSLKDKQSHIVFFPSDIDENSLVTEIEDMGFEAFVKTVDKYVPERKTALARNMKEAKLKVYGMTCESCVRSIQQNVLAIIGVIDVQVSLDDKEAVIKYYSDKTNTEAFKEAIEDAGFQVSLNGELQEDSVKKVAIQIKGITFQSCVEAVKQTLGETEGVKKVEVGLNSEITEIWYQPATVSISTLLKLIQQIGFEAYIFYPDGEAPKNRSVLISIEGMTCNSCVKSIEGNIGDLAGVKSIKVSLEEKSGRIVYNPDVTGEDFLRDSIIDMGFEAIIEEPSQEGGICWGFTIKDQT